MGVSFHEDFEVVIPRKVPEPYIRRRPGRKASVQAELPARSNVSMIPWTQNLWGAEPFNRMRDPRVLNRFSGR